jgi:sulfonate transport system ATP-binding protein
MSLFSSYSGALAQAGYRSGDAPAPQAALQRRQPPPLGLKLKALNKRFGARHVLKNIDLTVAPGEFVAIVGRSGCGKSTLLRLLAGLEKPSDPAHAGSAAIAGEAIGFEGAGPLGARLLTRIMFQDARLLPWKRVLDNVALGLPASERTHAREVLALVGLEERAADWPAVLSGGQRQRVALARALVHRPRLLLLDEPLGALDALTRIEMQQLIEDVWQRDGFTSILVTHDVSEAVALADRVIVIEEGQIVFNEKIDLARPRVRGSAAFAALEGRVLNRVLKQPDSPAKPPPPPPAPIQIRHLRIAV